MRVHEDLIFIAALFACQVFYIVLLVAGVITCVWAAFIPTIVLVCFMLLQNIIVIVKLLTIAIKERIRKERGKTMKVKLKATVTKNTDYWTFLFIPTLAIAEHKHSLCIVLQWLHYAVYVEFLKDK